METMVDEQRATGMNEDVLTLESAVLKDVPVIVEYVVDWLQQQKLDKYVFSFETAVDEASTNVVKYAYGGRGGFFQISCMLEGRDIVVTIRDRAAKFDPASVPAPEVDSTLEDRKVGGLGIYMMKKMMDRVDYSYKEGEGNRLLLVKRISGQADDGPVS
jgi:anti-sigma regulatory factor (Ser/Thr protein kinase)